MAFAKHFENKKHIIWDWNGTILNDLEHTVATLNHTLKDQNIASLSLEDYKKQFGFPVKDFYDDLGVDYTHRSFAELCDDFVAFWMNGAAKCKPFPFIFDQLQKNHSEQKVQSILSATDQENLDLLIDQFELRHFFTNVYGIADKFAASKIDRGRELIEVSGFAKEESVLVGDTLHDLEVGEELGIDVVLVSHGHQCATRLKAKHPHVLSLDLL